MQKRQKILQLLETKFDPKNKNILHSPVNGGFRIFKTAFILKRCPIKLGKTLRVNKRCELYSEGSDWICVSFFFFLYKSYILEL